MYAPVQAIDSNRRSRGFMHRVVILAAASSLAVAAHGQQAPPTEQPYWTPDAALIAKLEAGLRIIPGTLPGYTSSITYPLAQYNRYYAGVTVNGQRWIRGVLLLPPNREDKPQTGVHVTDLPWLPRLPPGGGCAHVTVTYLVNQNDSTASCALLGAGVPPSERPHWQPDEPAALRLERALGERLRGAQLPGLASYSRYYRGVTIDARPMIRARVLMSPGLDQQMHLASDWDVNTPTIFDGGCSNITATWDVEAARFTELRCDGAGFRVLSPDR